jgi:hypothetical protein
MQRLAVFLLALVLAGAPRPGVSESLSSTGLITPPRPLLQGFGSLFQSLPARIVPEPSHPAPLTAPATATLPQPGSPSTVGTFADGAICRPALVAGEVRHGIPSGLLQAIGIVESGRRNEATGRREPWPWAINAEGEPHFFETKQQAVAWVRQAQARGMQSIDVGCAQINLMHHPTAFGSLEQAFDPASNADYAARFLQELRNTTAGGNWMTAVGQYHSQTPELAEPYRQQVQAAMAQQPAGPRPAIASTLNPVAPFAPAGPIRVAVGARPEPARILAAREGTVGRGLDAYRALPIQMVAATRLVTPGMHLGGLR